MRVRSHETLVIALLVTVVFVALAFDVDVNAQTPSPTQVATLTPVPNVTPQSTVSVSTNQPTSAIEIIEVIATIATPIVLLMLSGIGWTIRNRFERARELEEKLRGDRIQVYNDILEPFIMLFTKGTPTEKGQKNKTYHDIASEKIQSLEYKQAAFKLSLMGSDEVLKAYNNLMQFFYDDGVTKSPELLVPYFGGLLLEIRRSVGNEATDLNNYEILEFLITDIRKFKKDGKYPSLNN